MQTKGSLDKPVQTSHVKENHVTQSNQHDNIDGISLSFEKVVNGSNMICKFEQQEEGEGFESCCEMISENEAKQDLVDKIQHRHILDDIRDNCGTILKRSHLTTRKDIANIERTFGLRRAERHKDATSVAVWVQGMMKSESNPILLYKSQGSEPSQETPSLEKNDFILVLQTPLQEDMLINFGSNIICMYDTHGTNSYDFSIITFLVVDEYGEGFPAAWCLCNRTDKYIRIDCLMAVRIRVGSIKPKWVMTDDAEQYFSAWVAVFGLGPRKLLCTWHVDRAWRGAVNKIKDKEVAATVYHNV